MPTPQAREFVVSLNATTGEPGLNQKASSVGETCVPSNLETEADDSFLYCGVLRLVDLAGRCAPALFPILREARPHPLLDLACVL